jgi:hypothetical protein
MWTPTSSMRTVQSRSRLFRGGHWVSAWTARRSGPAIHPGAGIRSCPDAQAGRRCLQRTRRRLQNRFMRSRSLLLFLLRAEGPEVSAVPSAGGSGAEIARACRLDIRGVDASGFNRWAAASGRYRSSLPRPSRRCSDDDRTPPARAGWSPCAVGIYSCGGAKHRLLLPGLR